LAKKKQTWEFVTEWQQLCHESEGVLVKLLQILQRAMTTFAHICEEGCQHPVIIYQKVLLIPLETFA
jgi:hypothetical protein